MKVCLDTFGCRLNRAEALDEEARYLAAGWETTVRHSEADLIVVRGCSVTARAQSDCEKLIAHIKRKYPAKRLIVRGCLAAANRGGEDRILETQLKAKRVKEIPLPSRTARAYLKVQDGCAGKCTFCIVPKFRGNPVSTDFGDAVDRARRFIDAGYREIVITGCNLSAYASCGKRLPELLAAVSDLSSECRARIGSLEPCAVAKDVVDIMAERANVCKFLHLPIQSASPGMLVAMRRPYRVADVEKLVVEARRRMPDIAIGYDLMAGFPGESEIDFAATKSFLARVPFSKAHVFPFSERPGTIAAALPGRIPAQVRRTRAGELARIADENRAAFARKFIGKTVEIVVESESEIAGWTAEYLWCKASKNALSQGGRTFARKGKAKMRVISAEKHVLCGDPV